MTCTFAFSSAFSKAFDTQANCPGPAFNGVIAGGGDPRFMDLQQFRDARAAQLRRMRWEKQLRRQLNRLVEPLYETPSALELPPEAPAGPAPIVLRPEEKAALVERVMASNALAQDDFAARRKREDEEIELLAMVM